ncbi:hypothetical protein Dda_3689 [Drechslerella dactyloides]|uniref:Uncharacterized protein n=1 Tax=Drechslerella dactyloides TaxID=74499 RepID=A0AAD6NJS5_DREDA|nr:hypothetical protein Dda_3689 [Drechslerella dactyloides]
MLSHSRAAFFVVANTLLSLSLSVHAFPLAQIYNEVRGLAASTSTLPPRPRVTHIEIRTAGPTQAGIITHPPAKQAVLKAERPEPVLLPHSIRTSPASIESSLAEQGKLLTNILSDSGLWTRGGLKPSTYVALDNFLVANDKRKSFYYTLTILGLGLNEHPDGLWKFCLRVEIALPNAKEAKGHTKLPQLTASFEQPHPKEANSYIIGDMMDFYELTEKDILEMITKDEPADGVMRFLSSRVSKMPGFSHKHVGGEEFDIVVARTTTPQLAGN